jgi:hypothetical protein
LTSECGMHMIVHKLSVKAERGQYMNLQILSITGVFKAFYEQEDRRPEHENILFRSSAAYNLMQIIKEVSSEGGLHNEMLFLNETIKGTDTALSCGKTLSGLIRNLAQIESRAADQTVCKVVLLAVQASLSNFSGLDFWLHMRGLSGIFHERGFHHSQTGRTHLLINACRTSLLYMQMFNPGERFIESESNVYRQDHSMQIRSTEVDTLVDFMRSVLDLIKIFVVCEPDQNDPNFMLLACRIVAELKLWYEKVSTRVRWAVQGHSSVKCPFDSFLIFADPLSAEICLTYYTILLVFADFLDSHSGRRWVAVEVAKRIPDFDAFTLAYDVGRMVPYFLAGGFLGYFVVNLPVRFALRCFTRLQAVKHEGWLRYTMETVQLTPFETRSRDCPETESSESSSQ